MAKKKHETPEHLDYLFERHIIEEESYGDFWERYWSGNARERRDLEQEYIESAAEELPEPEKAERLSSGKVTRSKAEAGRQAKAIGGYVIRRNAKGQFSARGKHYQAIRRRKK